MKNNKHVGSGPELTWRCMGLSMILTMLLAISNAYLALKLGILASASIPAAIISMGVLRLFKNATVLEHNAVQTAASAGEAVAGGIVYTIPALIITGYWHHFDYGINVLIALCGGVLGVLFSVPLRKILVNDPHLAFPEGKAIAAVLTSTDEQAGLRDIIWGTLIGTVLELAQNGFKILSSGWTAWFRLKQHIFCIGLGFSATMLGAGYLVGFDMACSIGLGAAIAWLGALPILSGCYPAFIATATSTTTAGLALWNQELRYFGIGAMLCAGLWTLLTLFKPLLKSIRSSLQRQHKQILAANDRDLPWTVLIIGVALMLVVLVYLLKTVLPVEQMGFYGASRIGLIAGVVLYITLIGFVFSVITAYFSGMVGVTASPGSSIVIAGILLAGWMLLSLMSAVLPLPLSPDQIAAAQAVVIVIAAVVTGIAAIANDSSQDLKVGQLVGSTPWKQQFMLLFGVVISALVIPPVMQMMFDVYGIAGVMPHSGMDISKSLPAPTAALLAAITGAVLSHGLPWAVMIAGAGVIAGLVLVQRLFRLERWFHLSLLGVAIGIYLPVTSSLALLLGGVIAKYAERRVERKQLTTAQALLQKQIGTRIACGLVAGSALMDVFLAIPFSLQHSAEAWRLVTEYWEHTLGVMMSVLSMIGLAVWIVTRVERAPS